MSIAIVVLPLPIRQCFKYYIPHSMIPVIGGRVIVPFRSKNLIGIVLSIYSHVNEEMEEYKHIISVIDHKSLYTHVLLDILVWLSNYYYCPIGNIFFSILPTFLRKGKCFSKKYIIKWSISKKGLSINIDTLKKAKKQLETLLFLKKRSILSYELKQYNLSRIILNQLKLKELCIEKILLEDQYSIKNIFFCKKNIFLNKKLIFYINKIIHKKDFSCWLLTQCTLHTRLKFYIGLMEKILNQKCQILILIPCIKYINRIIYFLNLYFDTSIVIIHSQLTDIQYLKKWMSIKDGKNQIIIGTRTSVFLPFFKLGLIIVFEENNIKYYNNNHIFKYNARDIGILRAFKEKIPVILDSDTPSLKILYNLFFKKLFFIQINSKHFYNKVQYKIIDLKKEKIKYFLSLSLINEMHSIINNKKQILLIFNNLNFVFFGLMCSFCGWRAKCDICHDYYEIDQYNQIMLCRYCLIKISIPIYCCSCKLFSLTVFNFNIKYIKKVISFIFPNILLIFLNDKKCFKKQLNENFFRLSSTIPCIIITTEDIAQYYFFPNVKLISLICIDHYFLSFNFRSIEYFSQFYIGLNKIVSNIEKTVKILIQTSFPHKKELLNLCNYGYFPLINKIFQYRKKFLLPPWSYQVIICSYSFSNENSINFLFFLRVILKMYSQKDHSLIWLVGPHPYFLSKYRKGFTYNLLIQHSSRTYLHQLLQKSLRFISYFSIFRKVQWFVDIDNK
ncbi:replication restart helicase PriA [Buchnera aphidicola]|uniref:replication restart helicase PriA n=1 Tax=Buchnera aphidicola TaxID=9 RepID=UPI003BEF3B55